MVIGLHGIPGSGKNVYATHLALKKFKHENNILKRGLRRILHKEIYNNNIYTSYPICLKHFRSKKKEDIYSNRCTIYDLIPSNRFKENALIIIDETQAFYDSEEYRDFPKDIAIFNQFHRHFDIENIIYITQHPSRLLKKLCVLCSEFIKVDNFLVIPIIHLGFMHLVHYYERDDYGKYSHPKKEAKTYDVNNSYHLFWTNKVFKSYTSKYMGILNYNSPLYSRGQFKNLGLSESEVSYIFRDKLK